MTDRLELKKGAPRITLIQSDDEQPVTLLMPAQGAAGPQGLTGPQGASGLRGNEGPQGERGPSGDTTVKVIAASGQANEHTGDTNEASLATIVLPAKHMGANGRLRIMSIWSVPNNANDKTIRVRFGGMSGTIYHQEVVTTVATVKVLTEIEARGASNSQVGTPADLVGYGPSNSAVVTSNVDTENNVDICLTGQLEDSADSIMLEAYLVELLMPPAQAEIGLYYAGDGIIIDEDFKVHVDRDNVAPLDGPVFIGNPIAPTPADNNDSDRLATTAFVQGLIAGLSTVYAPNDAGSISTLLGLASLALRDLITWSELDTSVAATAADYRSGAGQKLLTPSVIFSAHGYVALTDDTTIALDLSTGFNFTVTLGSAGARTLGFPTNPKVGQSGYIDVVQPGAGGKQLDFASGYTFDQGAKPLIDVTAAATSVLYYHVRSAGEVRVAMAFKGVGGEV